MKRKVLATALALVLVFALAACSVSSSSSTTTTVSTTVTDANGNTTTNTVTNQIGVNAGTDGVTTTNETTTETTSPDGGEAEEPTFTADDLSEAWHERFTEGAEGVSRDGDQIYFAYDDPDDVTYAAIMIVSNDGEHLSSREGDVLVDDDHLILSDEDMESETPFTITDQDGETFLMTFLGDGDEATMTIVDADTIIDDMVAVWQNFTGA